ncbi:hypothetical protein ACGK9U_13890 [Mariniflexile sp. HNIBRBA6329]|uniref:hypothetical protein n=1 Tax=Mariniflexile sp. HNIBRBA6329 TaxID=3373088 RepID=UPI003747218B
MKSIKFIALFLVTTTFYTANAQEVKASSETKIDSKSYYEQRAMEDAKYEQQFVAKSKKEEDAFWEEQKAYEAQLKKRDRKAYKAYMKGKKEAYASHYNHCDAHCHHSDYYYHNASFYYYRYDDYYYRRYPQRRAVNTSVNVRTPRVSLGLF